MRIGVYWVGKMNGMSNPQSNRSHRSRRRHRRNKDGIARGGVSANGGAGRNRRVRALNPLPDPITLTTFGFAHGGYALARMEDGKIVFLRGALPDETVLARIDDDQAKRAFGHVEEVLQASPVRVPGRCQAAAAGGGCCDLDFIEEAAETELKLSVLKDQLGRLAKGIDLEAVEIHATSLPPETGWRTRTRLFADEQGRPGVRGFHSHSIHTGVACAQLPESGLAGLIGEGASEFTPGAEVRVVWDHAGNRHVAERSDAGIRLVEGAQTIDHVVKWRSDVTGQETTPVHFPVSIDGFWQAHRHAPETYSRIIESWIAHSFAPQVESALPVVAWDLYGGVGAFVPAIRAGIAGALGKAAGPAREIDAGAVATPAPSAEIQVYSVEQVEVTPGDVSAEFVTGAVEKVCADLPAAQVVVLDPPRQGADRKALESIVAAAPQVIVHIGCDPATFARDVQILIAGGFELRQLEVVNAFPGSHHFETLALLVRR